MSFLQKITAAYRIVAYGTPTDSVDEYIRIGESTVIESLRRFVKAVITMFGDHYLRSPNNIDIARLLQTGEQRGFPGMLGSIDCSIGSEKIVLSRDKICILVIVMNQQSF